MQAQRFKKSSKKILFSLVAGILGLALPAALAGCTKEPEVFADVNVVAQFSGGLITSDQLISYVSKIGPKCHMPAMGCHGGSASSGCASDSSCESHDGAMPETQIKSSDFTGSADPTSSSCCGDDHGGAHSGCCGGSDDALADQAFRIVAYGDQ